jgi:small GTP-binding protein
MPTIRRMKAKLALLGEGGVGKTSLIRRFVLNEYEDAYLHTVGTRVSKIELTVPHGADVEVHMDMSIFDIMGQRGFRDMIRETYFHGAQALMAVCDITRKDSLTALNEWIPAASEISGDVPLYIVVNKKDLIERRAITEDDIHRIGESFGAPFVLTSAKTGEFVEDAFNSLAIEIVDRAIREEQARAAERGLRSKILTLLAKRGPIGLRKQQFLEILRGIAYDELMQELSSLEREGLVTVAWQGPTDFSAQITPLGERSARGAMSFEDA